MSKAGVYVVQGPTGLGAFLSDTYQASSPVPLLMSLDQNIAATISDTSPTTKLVFRTQQFGADNGNMYVGDPVAAGRARVDQCWPILQQNPAAFYAIINEPGRADIDALTWLCNFYIGAMQRADELGIKLCVGEWSTGMPPISATESAKVLEWLGWSHEFHKDSISRFDKLREQHNVVIDEDDAAFMNASAVAVDYISIYAPMLRYAMAHGHILGLHEYSLSGPMQGSPLCTRYRQLYAALPADARPMLAITECGSGAGYGTALWGQAYINDLGWYDLETMRDPYVIGLASFKLGGNESNMAEVMPLLTQWVIDHPTEGVQVMGKGGLHLSANGNHSDDPSLPVEIAAMQTARITRAKFMSNGDPAFVHDLIVAGIDMVGCVCRLYAAGDNTALGDPARFFDEQKAYITEVYGHGVRLFEIHNEPNLGVEGFGKWWASPDEFANKFYKPVAQLIRANFPLAKLVYPGLSPQPDWQAWKPSIASLITQGLVDLVGVHCYWDSLANMRSSEQGRTYERFTGLGRDLIITEASWNVPAPDVDKGKSYAEYFSTLPAYVNGAFIFVSYGPAYDGSGETWVRGNPPALTAIPAAVGAGYVPPSAVYEFQHSHLDGGAANPARTIQIMMNADHDLLVDYAEIIPIKKHKLTYAVNPPGAPQPIFDPPMPADGMYLDGQVVTVVFP